MKRFLIAILSVAMLFCIAGCETYKEAVNRKPSGSDTSTSRPSGGGIGSGDEIGDFTVKLTGVAFERPASLMAQWKGEDGSTYRAAFDENGVATTDGLDGEYSVTLVSLPNQYVYNPNIYFADNDHRDVEIKIYSVVDYAGRTGEPSMPTGIHPSISDTVAYRVTFQSVLQQQWFTMQSGVFETWCSTTENNVKPHLVGYSGNTVSGYWNRNDSATPQVNPSTSASYTGNYKCRLNRDDLAGKVFYVLNASSRTGEFPISVVFTLTVDTGGSSGGVRPPAEPTYQEVLAKEQDLMQVLQPSGSFRYFYYSTGRILDGSKVKLFARGTTDDEGNEGDGYYHLYTAPTAAEAQEGKVGVYGAILFAKLTQDNEIIQTDDGSGFMFEMINFQGDGKDYSDFLYTGALRTPQNYALYCNADGAHPVTAELKEALQAYAIGQRLFDDGEGWAEAYSSVRLMSTQDNQWLFCCGYYA